MSVCTELAARMRRKTHDIKQTQKMIPLISRENSGGQNVSKLVFGVSIFGLDLGFQVDSVKQPIKSNSVSPRHTSFDYHCDHSFVVFTDVQLGFTLRRMCVSGYVIHFTQLVNLLFSLPQFPGGWYVWVEYCLWLNLKPQTQCPKDQEQVTHPYVVQHPEK